MIYCAILILFTIYSNKILEHVYNLNYIDDCYQYILIGYITENSDK